MSRWFLVPVSLNVEVKVPDKEGPMEAREIAETLVHKRIAHSEWGIGNPWSATVRSVFQIGDPKEEAELDDEDEGGDDEAEQ
jgi:hypothetical protein